MSAMHKEELGRTILRVVGCLLCTDRIEVPDVNASIRGCRRKVDGRVR